jgi:Ca-activated chloride channel family protein
VVIVLDTSGSMSSDDGIGENRMDGAKRALQDFTDNLAKDTNLGLWAYPSDGDCGSGRAVLGSQSSGVSPVDLSDAYRRVQSLTPNGNTPTGDALREAAKMFRGSGPRTIVLISDGEENCGSDACKVAEDLAKQGINSIYTVGFQLSDGGRKQLQCIAEKGNGVYALSPR